MDFSHVIGAFCTFLNQRLEDTSSANLYFRYLFYIHFLYFLYRDPLYAPHMTSTLRDFLTHTDTFVLLVRFRGRGGCLLPYPNTGP